MPDVVARVLENRSLGGGYFLTTFESPAIASSCVPGQFVMAGSLDATELLLRRPFSVCLRGRGRSGEFESLALLYRVVGRGTSFLARLGVGESAALLGPLGRGFTLPHDSETPVIVAGGVGIAAFPFLVEELMTAGRPPVLLYGGRTANDLPMLDWLRERVRSVEITTDDGSAGEPGLVTAPLERRLARACEAPPLRGADSSPTPDSPRPWDAPRSSGSARTVDSHGESEAPRDRLYVCGPHPMMKAVAAIAIRHGTACEVALETPMACGYGVCVGCVVEVHRYEGEYGRFRRVCVDGPVFEAAEIRW